MMLILGRDRIYFADRDHCIFQVQGLTFPHYKDGKRHLTDTVLDGVRTLRRSLSLSCSLLTFSLLQEMVIDHVVEKNKINGALEDKYIPRYLVYDIIACDGKDVSSLPFKRRYDCIDVCFLLVNV